VDNSVVNASQRDVPERSTLERGIELGGVTWSAVAWVGIALAGVALRLAQLDMWALGLGEARRAFAAFALFRGSSLPPGDDLPATAPLLLLLQSVGFFLFGVTDATARIVPAFLGVALILLIFGLRPFVGTAAALGMATLAALSPTLVNASRTIDPAIAVACFTLLLIVTLLHCGRAAEASTIRRNAVGVGIALGALLASGPNALTVLLALGVGIVLAYAVDRGTEGRGAIQIAIAGIRHTPGAPVAVGAAFLVTTLTFFTRLFTDLTALAGLGQTFADWGRLLATRASTTPTQFFLLALLLYETLAVFFAVVAIYRARPVQRESLGWPFFVGWFAAALLLFSFSAGRSPDQAVHIALPLILLGGGALGELFASINWSDVTRGLSGLLLLAMLGLVVALFAFLVLAGRVDSASANQQTRTIVEAAIVVALVVGPTTLALVALLRMARHTGRSSIPGQMALLVAALVLGAFLLRSTLLLNLGVADEGRELLAQRTSTAAVHPLVNRITRLSRDTTVTRVSERDNTGSFGLTIALAPEVRWPYQWYFRDFPELRIAGPEGWNGADVVIAADAADMAEASYMPQTYSSINRVPPVYTNPPVGDVLLSILLPSRWVDALDYLLFRQLDTAAASETVTVGLDRELTARIFPSSGPYTLADRLGPGQGRGQFEQPSGVGVSPDGLSIYVVDAGNLRVQRFTSDGEFIGIWGDQTTGDISFATEFGEGPSGIAVGQDGLIYVADTWNHRVIVLDPNGGFVRDIGERGVLVDTADAPAADVETGRFYGPRGVAVDGNEGFVVDTGNERVQVFALDGTFSRSWGGRGAEPGQFVEPVGITIGPDDRVYVADSFNERISVFEKSGNPVAQWHVDAWTGQGQHRNFLTFGLDGNLYATSPQSASVEVLSIDDGSLIRSITEVNGEGIRQPVGITAAPDGTILIADTELDAVLLYIELAAPNPEEPVPGLATPASPAATPGG